MSYGSIVTMTNNRARIEQPIVGAGTTAAAYTTGNYIGPSDATYVITISEAGSVGEAVFSCRGIITDPEPLRDPDSGIIVQSNDIDDNTYGVTSENYINIGSYGVQMRWDQTDLTTSDSWTIYVTARVMLEGDIITSPVIGMVLEKIKPMEEGSVALYGVFDNIPVSVTTLVDAWDPAYYDHINGVVTDSSAFTRIGAFAKSCKPSDGLCRIMLNSGASPKPWTEEAKRNLIRA